MLLSLLSLAADGPVKYASDMENKALRYATLFDQLVTHAPGYMSNCIFIYFLARPKDD